MDDESAIIESSLSRKITREGTTIEVLIYRSVHEKEWILEVVDHEGESAVWEETFQTEQDALNEVFQTIASGGMSGFVRAPFQKLH